ncbi:MAG: J domain-containing protein [Myxococcota bacterium]
MVKKDLEEVRVDLLCVNTIEELKRFGRFREVKQELQARLGAGVTVRARSWQKLLNTIRQVAAGCTPRPREGHYFVSEATKAIFALLELHGDAQFSLLDITVRHFGDVALAKAWRDRLAKLVHPDRCTHPAATRAMAEVSAIYEAMVAAAP